MIGEMVKYSSAAKRSNANGRPNYAGFMSAWAVKFFGRYMLKHQTCADGSKREAHNWKYGMPMNRYVESLSRHYQELSELWDRLYIYQEKSPGLIEDFEETMGAVMFNIQGLIHEWERSKEHHPLSAALASEAQSSSDELPKLLRKAEDQSTQSSAG